MKAIAYHISPQQKELLIVANHKKHEITVIGNPLNIDTLAFAAGKEALLIFNEEVLDASLIDGLKRLGIKYLATASFATGHIDIVAAQNANMKISNVPFSTGTEMENIRQLIKNLTNWSAGKCVGKACCCAGSCAVDPI